MFCLPFSYDWVDTKNEQFDIKIQKPFHKEHVDATNFHLKMSYLTLTEWKEYPKNQPIIWHILINVLHPSAKKFYSVVNLPLLVLDISSGFVTKDHVVHI